MQRANRGSLEEENDQRRARRIIPGVREHESAQRAAAREDGVTRQMKTINDALDAMHQGGVERESTQ